MTACLVIGFCLFLQNGKSHQELGAEVTLGRAPTIKHCRPKGTGDRYR